MATQPLVIVLGGPNGAGKSTASARLLPEWLTFVNADEVAKTLPNYPSSEADREAGGLVLLQMEELEHERADLAVETTLAGRPLASRLRRLKGSGYVFRLLFLFIPGVDLAIARVAGRVRQGDHNIPVDTIRRRYRAGLECFFENYRPLADRGSVYDTSRGERPRFIAGGPAGKPFRIRRPELWQRMQREAG